MKNNLRERILKYGEIVPLKYDFHFVRVFGNEDNIDIIEYFISDFYNIPLEEVVGNIQILSRDLKQESKREKSKQVDLLLKLGDKKINIEISSSVSKGRKERDLVFLSRIHGGQLEYRQNYKDIGTSWQLRLNDTSCNNGKLVKTYFLTSQDEDRDIYSEKFRIDNVDLEVARKIGYNDDNEKRVRWCKIITASSRNEIIKELGDRLMDKKTRNKLVKEVEKNSRDEDIYDIYEMYSTEKMERDDLIYEAIEKTTKEVTKEVTEEVTKKNAVETAKKLLEEGIDISIISRVTGLSKADIEKLK